jgi:hypothetical protein
MLLLVVTAGLSTPSHAQAPGYVSVVFAKAGLIVGAGRGRGVLTYRGRDYPFRVSGLSPGITMGVQRTSVSGVASRLQEEGLIDYHRGKMRIVSIDGVQRRACECHEAVREQYVDVFGKVAAETFPGASGLIQTV